MRELKFRVWTGERMWTDITGFECTNGLIDGVFIDGDYRNLSKGEDGIELMQFTSLLDKSGKEIYEGDVVRTPNGDWGVIQYEAPFFGVTVSDSEVSNYRRDWMESCEVIGNIHKNPELMEVM